MPNRENGLPIEEPSGKITNLLRAWSGGDQAALDRLAEQVYPELRRMARRYMKNERQANTLQSTALVHEVYPASWTCARLTGASAHSFMRWQRR